MSIYFREGDKPTASELNQPYINVGAFTVATENCASSFATRKHFDDSGIKINTTYSFSKSAGAVYTKTSSTVTNASSNAVITLNNTVASDTLFRFSWDTLVGDNICANDGASTGNPAYNIYVFRLKVLLNSGAITKYVSSAAYSYNGRANPTSSGTLNPNSINWRSCAGTGLLNVASGVTIDSVTLEAATGGAGANTLKVSRFNMNVIEVKQ
mgnify:CR=1 FL=1